MNFLKVNFDNRESILQSFDHIAQKLANEIQIRINDALYRVVDFEFYNYSKALPDPHTYQHPQQQESSKFYLHASGVDITFGNEINHGGILLRGLVELKRDSPETGFMSREIFGPQKVATELFSNLLALDGEGKNEISLIDIDGNNQDSCHVPARTVINTKRVGLTAKATDPDNYYMNLPLRYIAIMKDFKNFKQSRKGYESLLKEQVNNGKMTVADAHEILRYQKSFG